MKLSHIKQGHNNCGQTCLAMISGRSVPYVSDFIKKKRGTRAADYINFLESHSFKVINKRFKRCNWDTKLPKLCIIKGHNIPETPYTHVIVHCDGVFHEPAIDRGLISSVFIPWRRDEFKITSYMEIEYE